MCISLWSTNNNLDYRLILASNRDEFFHRPSSPAAWHSFEEINHDLHTKPIHKENDQLNNDNQSEILSGRDLIAGGTWLGINKNSGKFGFLTNVTSLLDVREEQDQADNQDGSRLELSRGNLIRDFLKGHEGVESYINVLKSSNSVKHIRGFNLVIGQLGKTAEEADQLGFFSNRDPAANYRSISMTNYQDHENASPKANLVCGISNGIAAQSPVWPKVSLGISLMEHCFKSHENLSEIDQNRLVEDLFHSLSQTNDSTENVPSNILIRPHHRLSSAENKPSHQTWYGTRTQSIVLVTRTTPTRVTFVERDAFYIQSNDQPGDDLGEPVWRGDDRSRWRRFEFELSP